MTRTAASKTGEPRDQMLRVRISATEAETLAERAAADGVPLSEWVRRRLGLRSEKPSDPRTIARRMTRRVD